MNTKLLYQHFLKSSGVSTDTRKIDSGNLFFALKGPNFNANTFAAQALEIGAALVVVDEADVIPNNDPRYFLVDDVLTALQQLALYHRRQLSIPIIGLTGSNGKTTVKTLLAHLLAGLGKTQATQGNFNNHIGVPKTLLSLESNTEYAVIEMGANHVGEIHELTGLAQPNIAILTLAAPAHVEGFGSLANIIKAKGEIFDGLQPRGLAIINRDSPGFDQWHSALLKDPRHFQVLTFGQDDASDLKIATIESLENGLTFELIYQQQAHRLFVPLLGAHNAYNAAIAAGVCLHLGMDWESIQVGLNQFRGVGGRLQRYQIGEAGLLIDDSYNANPSSVQAAIDTLACLPSPRVFCLGAMAELGEMAEQAHWDMGAYARQKGIEFFASHGDLTAASHSGYGNQTEWSSKPLSHEGLVQQLQKFIEQTPKFSLLIKGSRSAQMDKVVQTLLERNPHAHLS
jgi:UDP-N-acetylmuramoyl-tripeptide--D-alanyl-D-alanine ligase